MFPDRSEIPSNFCSTIPLRERRPKFPTRNGIAGQNRLAQLIEFGAREQSPGVAPVAEDIRVEEHGGADERSGGWTVDRSRRIRRRCTVGGAD